MDVQVNIFYSYSHTDQELCEELLKHLKPMVRKNVIKNWYDRKIVPGDRWNEQIRTELMQADIILFLLSSDFLNSDFIFENEIKLAIEQYKADKAVIIPIMLRKCDIEYTELKNFQGLPQDLKPVTSKHWYNKDDAYVDIVEGLKRKINEISLKKQILFEDKDAWEKANSTGTVESYNEYLFTYQNSSKQYTREAVNRLQELNLSSNLYIKKQDELELELLRRDREYISQEIHDNVGQMLSVVKMGLSLAEKRGLTQEQIADMKNLLNDAINLLRRISRSLSQQVDEGFNLKDALLNLQYDVSSVNGPGISLTFEKIELLDKNVEVNIYRIIQELISNVLNHSNAKSVDISVLNLEKEILLSFKDDGIGLQEGGKLSNGLGMRHIRSRVEYFNGSVEINGTNGVEVKIRIPR